MAKDYSIIQGAAGGIIVQPTWGTLDGAGGEQGGSGIDIKAIATDIEALLRDDFYSKQEIDSMLVWKQDTLTFDTIPALNSSNPVTSDGIFTALSGKADTNHTHDDRYYTETETDTKLAGKLNNTGSVFVTGDNPHINAKDTVADTSASSISSDRWVGFGIADKNNRYLGYLEGAQYQNGQTGIILGARNVVNGSNVTHELKLKVDKSGNRTVEVTDPIPWRNALGASSGLWPVSLGGTGASDKANARKNLGFLGMFFAESVVAAECSIIPSNANLNTPGYCATGKYVCQTNVQAATLTNCPTAGVAFQLLVYNLLGSGTGAMVGSWDSRTRILMTYQGNIWVQSVVLSGGNYTYGSWMKIATS